MLSAPGLISVSPALSMGLHTLGGHNVSVANGKQEQGDIISSKNIMAEAEPERSDRVMNNHINSTSSVDGVDPQAPLRVAFVSRFFGEQASRL